LNECLKVWRKKNAACCLMKWWNVKIFNSTLLISAEGLG
jgi:hypothetical protein